MSDGLQIFVWFLCVMLFCFGTVTALSPRFLRFMAAELISQAEAVESMRKVRADGRRHWRTKLGVAEDYVE